MASLRMNVILKGLEAKTPARMPTLPSVAFNENNISRNNRFVKMHFKAFEWV
jgi:hypothetical protein